MPDSSDASQQACPTCGTLVDVREAEPLASVICTSCGGKFRVERAFDNFALVETLGVGGMGSVYKARDTRLDRYVALKLLRKELSENPVEAARLEQEARVTAAVNHPNVVQVYSTGTAHGQIYLVMELVDHGSLDDLMAQQTRVPEAQALQAGIQVAKGLQAAQQKGLIHRDVKPANILFSDAETAKIGDFGLAVASGQKTEAQKEIWGTPYYVAPERLNNEPEDFRSDIYSLGATLFHALAGRPPMEGDSTSAAELRRLKSHPPELHKVAPDISRETSGIIGKMLAPDPAHRFTSYAHVINKLQHAARGLPGAMPQASTRPRWLLPFVAVLVLLLGAGAGAYFLKTRQAASGAAATTPAPTATPANTAALQQRYEQARRQLIEGKHDAAATALTRLTTEAKDKQPLLNWIRLHNGLAALMQSKSAPARDAFSQVERDGAFSTARSDRDLANFFVETGRKLAAPGPVRASALAAEQDPKGANAFALFLFAIKNWQLSDFNEAAILLERYVASNPPTDLAWINDYKPIARKYLEDHRTYTAWQQLPPRPSTAADLRSNVEALRNLEKKLQMRGALADALKDEAKRQSNALAQREKSEIAAQEKVRTELLAKEQPTWIAARDAAHASIDIYDFAAAASALNVPLSEASLREARDAERKKVAWLLDWKKKLISDLRTTGYAGAITDLPNVQYAGAKGATETEINLLVPGGRGSAAVKWTALKPPTLLAMSSAFIQSIPAEVADRQWLAAVFASTTGQNEAAKALGEAAAKGKPEYRELLPSLLN